MALAPPGWVAPGSSWPCGGPALEGLLARAADGRWDVASGADSGRFVVLRVGDERVREYALDPEDRLVHVEERGPYSRQCLACDLDPVGRLVRETMTRFVGEDLVSTLHADHHRDDDGRLRCIVLTDGVGRRVEEQTFDPDGRLVEVCRFDHVGRVSYRELYTYDDDRLVQVQRRRVDPRRQSHPVWDSTERLAYSPATGRLASRILVERCNLAGPGERPDWRRVMEEVIDYDPEGDEASPIRDETRYFDRDADGVDVERHRILLIYPATDAYRVAEIRVIEEDLFTGEVRERWSRSA